MPKKTRSVRRLYDEVASWVRRPDNRRLMFEEPSEELEAYVRGEPLHLGVVASNLNSLDTWYSAKAVAEALESQTFPSETVFLGHRHGLWHLKLKNQVQLSSDGKKKSVRLSLNDESLTFARALAIGCIENAVTVGELLVSGVASGLVGIERSRVGPFLIRLFCQWRRLPSPLEGQETMDTEVYRKLLETWTAKDPAPLEKPLLEACELHVARTGSHTNKDYFEFWELAYSVYPVELLALLRLRNSLGLPTVPLHHPLMEMPMGRLTDATAFQDDPLLSKVVKRASS